ncbi:hypothetical protein ACJ72_06111 [Emergomyces africanus]|uniref:Uncharacterized protein n=1 Tax=Emergomyces africanus TaxID=1955775 RepID=A0A1B7NS04_9EURO|nr:hypothetical protein ACJ72_06111 [Emergomyces africanus]
MASQVGPPLEVGNYHPSPPRIPYLPAEIQEMIFTEISRAAPDVRSVRFWNESLTNKLKKSCDIEFLLAYANETITEKAVELWIDQVSAATVANPDKWERDFEYESRIDPSDTWMDAHSYTIQYINTASSEPLSESQEQKLCLYLLLAASRGFVGCLRALANVSVALGVSMANTNFHCTTFLQEAVRSGHLGVVNLLLDRGMDPSSPGGVGIAGLDMLPISIATQRLHVDIAASILAYKPVPDHGQVLFRDDDDDDDNDDDDSIANDGVYHVDDIDYWCVPERKGDWRLERLRYEVDTRSNVVAQIAEFGFIGCQPMELVSWAAYRSSLPMLKLLVERYSFSVDLERDLYWAFRGGGDVDVVRLLLRHGTRGTVAAPAQAKDFHPGRYRDSSVMMNTQGQGIGSAGIKGSQFTRSFFNHEFALRERVPVIDAVKYCNVDMVRLLLDTLPDPEHVSRAVNEFDTSFMTSLQHAVRKGDEVLVMYLLGCGAEIWQNCFDFVMTEGSSHMIELFSRWIKEHDLEVKKE